MKRGPATSEKRGMYHGIQVPLDAFEKPFAGGSEVDALPARLESLLFPHRYDLTDTCLAHCWAKSERHRCDQTQEQDEPLP